MAQAGTLTRLRYRFIPDHLIGEILSKKWIDNAIPFTVLVLVILVFGALLPNFWTGGNLSMTARQLGEFALVCLAMTIVIIVGGIDLSVGSNFALGNFLALAFLNLTGWPLWVAVPAVVLICGSVGLINGVLIGYLRLRAFLTTLVTLIIVRAVVDMLLLKYAQAMSLSFYDNPWWDLMGMGNILGLPFSFALLIVVALVGHVLMTALAAGLADDGDRRLAPLSA